jgi:hypothetical protein
MTLPVRYSPSGSPIANAGGAPLSFGPGARLRLTEAQSLMGGSQAIPTSPGEDSVISPDGFGDADAVVLTLLAPKQALQYRAKLSLDVINDSTNTAAEVVLYLDTSVDGGTTYTNRAKCVHKIDSMQDTNEARNMDAYLPLSLGSALGIDDGVPTPSIKLRARANLPVGTLGNVLVSSLSTSGGGSAVTGLNGTIHMELEECF